MYREGKNENHTLVQASVAVESNTESHIFHQTVCTAHGIDISVISVVIIIAIVEK